MADGDGAQGAETFTKAQVEEMVAGLKSKNTELLGSMAKLKDQLKSWDGLEPDKVREMLSAHEEATAAAQKAKGDWDAREKTVREQMAGLHKKELDPLKAEVESLRRDLFDAIAVRDALEAMTDPAVKAIPKMARRVIEPELGVEVVDGRRTTIIKGPDGKARYKSDGSLVGPKDRLLELKNDPDFAGMFAGSGSTGSGARASSSGESSGGVVMISRADAADPRKYQAMREQAAKAGQQLQIAPAS